MIIIVSPCGFSPRSHGAEDLRAVSERSGVAKSAGCVLREGGRRGRLGMTPRPGPRLEVQPADRRRRDRPRIVRRTGSEAKKLGWCNSTVGSSLRTERLRDELCLPPVLFGVSCRVSGRDGDEPVRARQPPGADDSRSRSAQSGDRAATAGGTLAGADLWRFGGLLPLDINNALGPPAHVSRGEGCTPCLQVRPSAGRRNLDAGSRSRTRGSITRDSGVTPRCLSRTEG